MWIIVLFTMLTSCLGAAPPAPLKTPDNPAWTAVASVISSNCAGCHNGSQEPLLTPSSVFLASPAKGYLTSGAMPPAPKTISATDKATLLNYLNTH